ncbi:MAG: toprim domain-containing protein [Caldilineaceae bacterium]|nr:toprim domain-containing protein [Caldilineaceae bacterium]
MRTHTNQIPIAAAAETAARIPHPHTISGGWYRTSTALCHGGGNRHALAFRDGERPGESSLRVHCHSRNCDPTAVRHALQQATGLRLCRCDACFAAFRAGQPPPGPDAMPLLGARRPESANRHSVTNNPANGPQSRSGAVQGKDTGAYAAALWAAAQPSAGPAPRHPAAKWLAQRGLWPPRQPLPQSVRWLPHSHPRFPRGQPGSPAAGALLMAMRPLDDPAAHPRKIQLVAIDANGAKAPHWPDNADKRTFGAGPLHGLLWRGELPAAGPLHLCEGLADGLRILRYAAEPALVAVCAGTSYARIDPGPFDPITLWPDADEPGARPAAKAAQRWADLGYTVTVKRLAAGRDPASAPLQEPEHD